MSIETLKTALPDYAKDLKLNLRPRGRDRAHPAAAGGTFSPRRSPRARRSHPGDQSRARPKLSPEALTAAKTAAAIMAMNNIYYRFVHLVGGDYEHMPARLRMNVIAKPGVDKVDFELWSLAVSAINGCGLCIEHEQALREAGVTAEAIQAAVRIAAVVHAVARRSTAKAWRPVWWRPHSSHRRPAGLPLNP